MRAARLASDRQAFLRAVQTLSTPPFGEITGS